jgi:hypothetical protein
MRYTAEPRTGAEVAPRPHERHALLEGLRLATPLESQDNSIGFGPHTDAA